LNFIYFTTITKQVIHLIFIMLVRTDVSVPVVFVWEGTGSPGGNPPVWLGDHMTISHADMLSQELSKTTMKPLCSQGSCLWEEWLI